MSDISYTMYRFYLKKTKELYAYTITKEYKKRFLNERNPDNFYLITSNVPDIEFMVFDNANQSSKLIPIVLNSDKGEYMEIIGTQAEEERMFWEIETIYNIIDYFRTSFTDFPFKKKYIYPLNTINSFDTDFKPRINSLALFSYLFKNTFVKEE